MYSAIDITSRHCQ